MTLKPLPLHPEKKSPEYLRFVVEHDCIICGSARTVAHHDPPKGMGGGRSTDWETVPLCVLHHRNVHGIIEDGTDWCDAEYIKEVAKTAMVKLLVEYIQRKQITEDQEASR